MKLELIGHEYKFAVDEIVLTLFPRNHPTSANNRSATSRLTLGSVYAQATTVIHSGDGQTFRGSTRVKRSKLTDDITTNRLLQRIVKESFYRAAVKILDKPPVWGSLTGIRPAKIIEAAIESGVTKTAAAKMLAQDFHVCHERAKICADIAQSSISLKRSLDPHAASLYVGIPFCPSRCAYCSFVSNSVEKSFDLIESYVNLLLEEILVTAKTAKEIGLKIISVYIGGGTPTALPANDLERIMHTLQASFDLSNVREYTVEAGRPDTITAEKLRVIKRFGANRVCVNPQSMSKDVLTAIGRDHTTKSIIDAAQLVKEYGFSLNMDVIAGLPADNPEGFQKTLDSVLELLPENITVHTLSLKKGSRIMLEETSIPNADDVGKMLAYASDKLTRLEYFPYYLYRQKYTSGGFENIGWCSQGNEGLYNKLMMEDLSTVIALGAGGVTKLVLPKGRIERVFNTKFPKEYILQRNKIFDKMKLIMRNSEFGINPLEVYHAISIQH